MGLEEQDKRAVERTSGPPASSGAFACPETELSPEERDCLLDSIADGIVRRGLATPAVFLLEMHKPLCFFGSQLLLLGSPILGAFFGFGRMLKVASLVQNRENVEMLIQKIEERGAATRNRGPE